MVVINPKNELQKGKMIKQLLELILYAVSLTALAGILYAGQFFHSANQLGIGIALAIVLLLLYLIKEFLLLLLQYIENSHLEYILQLKDQKGIKDLTQDQQLQFIELNRTLMYKKFSEYWIFLFMGILIMLWSFISLFLVNFTSFIIEFLVSLLLIVPTLTYLHGFMWYIEDLEDLADEERKDLEHYNKKYKLLVAEPLKKQLEKDENE